MPQDDSAIVSGDVIDGRYILGDRLGVGGMGIVYTALQTALERTVAIKFLRSELRGNALALRRFRDEALAVSRLSHPNIVGFHDFGETAHGMPFLAMHHLRGMALSRIVAIRGAFSMPRTISMTRQILAALVEIHRLDMVHADVKCDNVLVENDDHATLIDFGLVRLAGRTQREHDEISGTPAYLAPELVNGGPPTRSSDLYAVGCILYELVTGSTPFGGGAPRTIMARHVDDLVVPPSLRAPARAISRDVDAIVLRALAKDPADRFDSAFTFAQALADTTARPEPELGVEVGAGFSSQTRTLDLVEVPEDRCTRRWRKDDPITCARVQVGKAIAYGDIDGIIVAYLDLARRLFDAHRSGSAVEELEQAVDVVTCGAGLEAHDPPALWRLLVSMAAIEAGRGAHARARLLARAALAHATRVASHMGCLRARHVLGRVDHIVR